ncbi:glycosyltransferase family 39 protein [bacterium]|nr:glycosyltransferase family 39 protein [bacterium]
MKKRKFDPIPFFIIAIAFILRLVGIKWGLPNQWHYFSYHPDEILIIGASSNVDIFHLQLDPKFYNYGSLYIFIVSLLNTLGALLGFINGGPIYVQLSKMILLGRIASAIMGSATVWLIYIIGRKIYDEDVGKAGAFLLALAPLHMVHSHYTAVDVPTTFFVTLSFLFSALLLMKPKNSYYFWGGLFVGFATATKYNAILSVIPLLYLLFKQGFSSKRLALLSFGVISGFLLGCPGSLLNFPKFKHDFLYEMRHTRLGHGDLFVATGPGWLYNLRTLFFTLGAPIFFTVIAGLIFALIRHSPGDLLIISFVVPYFLLISFSNVRFARYLIPILPFILLLSARFFLPSKKNLLREIGIFAFILVSIYTSLLSLAYLRSLIGDDPRDLAGNWLRKNLKRGEKVGLLQTPWFYSPAFIPYNGGPMSQRDFLRWVEKAPWKVQVIGWDAGRLISEAPRRFVVSNFEYIHPLRLKRASAIEFWRTLEERYGLEIVFKRGLSFAGLRFPFVEEAVPEDVLYTFPEIRIYKLK